MTIQNKLTTDKSQIVVELFMSTTVKMYANLKFNRYYMNP